MKSALAVALAAALMGTLGNPSEGAHLPAFALSSISEVPASPGDAPLAIVKARIVAFAAERLGVDAEAALVTNLEQDRIPGSDDVWYLSKVATTDDASIVVYTNADTGEVTDAEGFQAIRRAAKASLGVIDPAFAQLLDRSAPSEQHTAAFLVKGSSRSEIAAGIARDYPTVFGADGRSATPDEESALLASAALRRAYGASVAESEATFLARARQVGVTIEYAAQFAPMVFVTGSASEIRELAGDSSVYGVLASGPTALTMNTAYVADQAGYAISAGWDGQAPSGYRVRIAVVEYGNVDWSHSHLSGIPTSRRVSYSTGSIAVEAHPTTVMATIASQNATYPGVAPEAFYISSSTGGDEGGSGSIAQDFRVLTAIDKAVDPSYGNADIVNLSIVQDKAVGASALSAYVDEITRSLYVHVTTSGGNHNNCDVTSGIEVLDQIRAPGDAWNGTTVGSIADQNSPETISDHCYIDPPGRSFKPT